MLLSCKLAGFVGSLATAINSPQQLARATESARMPHQRVPARHAACTSLWLPKHQVCMHATLWVLLCRGQMDLHVRNAVGAALQGSPAAVGHAWCVWRGFHAPRAPRLQHRQYSSWRPASAEEARASARSQCCAYAACRPRWLPCECGACPSAIQLTLLGPLFAHNLLGLASRFSLRVVQVLHLSGGACFM
eukprot:1150313-Pelagomonas_calceolata.AAC.2